MSKSAKAFSRKTTLTLANGEQVEVRKPDLAKLALNAKNGEIPSFLRQQVVNAMNGTPTAASEQQDTVITLDNAPEYITFIELVTKTALVWPVIKDAPTDADYENGFIAIDDLTLADKMQITTWAMPQDTQAVSSFRGEPGAIVEPPSDVQDLQSAPVGSNGNHG